MTSQNPPTQTRLVSIWRPSIQSHVVILTDAPITDAANHSSLQPGDIILVSCGLGQSSSGNSVLISFGSDETWPIKIKPGVTIKEVIHPYYQTAAMISSTIGNPAPAGVPLIQFVDAPSGWSATDPTAGLIGVDLVGGDIGALVRTATGGPVEAKLRDVVFSRNRVGLQVEATGAHTYPVEIRDCSTSTSFQETYHALDLKPFEVGVRFWSLADQQTGSGHAKIVAQLINYQTVGDFQASLMNPIAKLWNSNEPCDLAGYVPASGGAGTFTRIVEVGTRGENGRWEYPAPPSTAKQDVSAVDLTVEGGILDGMASAGSGGGWDVGIYAVADYPKDSLNVDGNYTSWFDLETNGTIVEDCRAAGVYVQTNTDTRGHLSLNNQTLIRKTGVQLGSHSSDTLYSGIHAVAKRSYLTVEGNTMVSRENAGNGMIGYSPGNMLAQVPMGLFVGLKKCGLLDNGRCGLRLEAAISHGGSGGFGRVSGAVVGGTQVMIAIGPSLSNAGSTPFIGDLPLQGQGFLDRCTITGAGVGTYGILFRARGNSRTTYDEPLGFSAIALRVVNTYVWDFAGGGIFAQLERHQASETGPTLLTPVVHSTIVRNPAFSIDVFEEFGASCRYYWDDPTGEYLNTMLVNSIFDTQSANLDFGTNLDPNWEYDYGTGQHSTNKDKIHLASIRALLTNSLQAYPYCAIDSPVPYEGGVSGYYPDQWFLDHSIASSTLTSVAPYLNAGGDLSEDGHDVENKTRYPFVTQWRNKGGEEDRHP